MAAKILLIGRNSQIGWELKRSLGPLGEVIAVDRQTMDLAEFDTIRQVIRRIKPNLIINTAAYTLVDKAETEPWLAQKINGDAPGIIAEEAKRIRAAVIHYSTDYVFDGTASTPYGEGDSTNPLNVYGNTKRAGELATRAVDVPHLIFRTSWVYGTRGRNFLLTILRLIREREELQVVNDQIGSPTWSRMIAEITSQILALGISDPVGYLQQQRGVYHMTAGGQTSWYGFAQMITENSPYKSDQKLRNLVPITTDQYPTPARRPAYSVMDNTKMISTFGLSMSNWEECLMMVMEVLKSRIMLTNWQEKGRG